MRYMYIYQKPNVIESMSIKNSRWPTKLIWSIGTYIKPSQLKQNGLFFHIFISMNNLIDKFNALRLNPQT